MVKRNYVYDLCILCLSIITLLQMAATTFLPLDASTVSILFYSDTGICFVFMLDFAYRLAKAPDRWRYFMTWGWLDLVSSIPAVGVFRWARIARILRIIRVFRGVRIWKELTAQWAINRAGSTLTVVIMILVVLLVVSSLSIVQFEAGQGGNIDSAQDAVWWSFVTMTTVGYGDKYPVTPEGRLLASLLMVAGIGLFGAFTGFVSKKFSEPSEHEQEGELQSVQMRLAGIEEKLNLLIAHHKLER